MNAADLLAVAGDGSTLDESYGCVTVDVPAPRWVEAATAIRDDPRSASDFFDWLSAYDDVDHGLAVVVRVWSLRHNQGVLLRTHVARDRGVLPTLTEVWPGAAWHERETFEMFGVEFTGHPHLVPLLLADGFEGNPLRKEFVLASRVAKAWPGAKNPGESDEDLARAESVGDDSRRARRRRIQPPGVPAPGSWGPQP